MPAMGGDRARHRAQGSTRAKVSNMSAMGSYLHMAAIVQKFGK